MSQKINPISLRLPVHKHFDSSWYNELNYKKLLFQDLFLRKYLDLIFFKVKKYPSKIILQQVPYKLKIHNFLFSWRQLNRVFDQKKIPLAIQQKRKKIKMKKFIKPFLSQFKQTYSAFLYFNQGFLEHSSKNFSQSFSKIQEEKISLFSDFCHSKRAKKLFELSSQNLNSKSFATKALVNLVCYKLRHNLTPLVFFQSLIRWAILQIHQKSLNKLPFNLYSQNLFQSYYFWQNKLQYRNRYLISSVNYSLNNKNNKQDLKSFSQFNSEQMKSLSTLSNLSIQSTLGLRSSSSFLDANYVSSDFPIASLNQRIEKREGKKDFHHFNNFKNHYPIRKEKKNAIFSLGQDSSLVHRFLRIPQENRANSFNLSGSRNYSTLGPLLGKQLVLKSQSLESLERQVLISSVRSIPELCKFILSDESRKKNKIKTKEVSSRGSSFLTNQISFGKLQSRVRILSQKNLGQNFTHQKFNSIGKDLKDLKNLTSYPLSNLSTLSNLGVSKPRGLFLDHIESTISRQNQSQTLVHLINIQDPFKSASILSFLIARKLESRVRFPRIKAEIFNKVQSIPYIQGIRLSCSGSFKGGLMARTYMYKFGETSLHNLSKKIDYSFKQAKTRYGILGIKVWISYR